MDKLKVGVVNLGCDKNRIDSEIVISKLSEKYDVINNPEIADIILINTCGFIEASKQESINTILEMAKYKEKHTCKVLIATGCLTQRYGGELLELIPELDIILGVNDYEKLHDSINDVINKQCKICECNFSDSNINEGNRVVTTGKNSAYLRIAEGCDNVCAYCAIPKIRGKYRSRKIENIILEAKDLAGKGYKEIILVAQDTTRYGIDIYGTKKLHELIKEISKIDSIKWIRILYCYAEELTDEIIDEIALNDKVCKYIDIPIQHISDEVLKNMRRRGRKKQITENIKKLRDKISEVTLRTSIIVGFPGETKDNFDELKDYIKDIKFDKMGVFKYSQEDGTVAADMENQIEDEIKQEREEQLMLIQQKISKDINERKVERVYEVLVESFDGEMYHGRNYEMSPEVDGEILFKCDKIISEGKFVKVKITEALEYDLIGVVLNESCE